MASSSHQTPSNIIIVVLGAPTTLDGSPGVDLKQRLDRCLEKIKDPIFNKCLVAVTGGNPQTYGSSGVCREGDCMRNYLVERGMEAKRIVVENRAVHTFHNALYVKTLLRQRGLLGATSVKLVVLTTDWHAERSVLCFKAVYCDTPNVTISTELVQSDPNVPGVIERVAKEKRLIVRWIPMCLEEEKNHPDMPTEEAAVAALKEAQKESKKVSNDDDDFKVFGDKLQEECS